MVTPLSLLSFYHLHWLCEDGTRTVLLPCALTSGLIDALIRAFCHFQPPNIRRPPFLLRSYMTPKRVSIFVYGVKIHLFMPNVAVTSPMSPEPSGPTGFNATLMVSAPKP